jgi:hypothetical protein
LGTNGAGLRLPLCCPQTVGLARTCARQLRRDLYLASVLVVAGVRCHGPLPREPRQRNDGLARGPPCWPADTCAYPI